MRLGRVLILGVSEVNMLRFGRIRFTLHLLMIECPPSDKPLLRRACRQPRLSPTFPDARSIWDRFMAIAL